MIGQTVSHYRIVEKIGEGGMGVVYLAEDTHLGRNVALKFLSTARDHHYRARFLREARAVSSLSHPHIAIIHDYGETADGLPFIVMEYVKGETLGELLNRSALTISRALEITEEVAEALGAAHAQGIVHRDIKPSNVMVNEQGQVKVLDFGLVKQLHDEHTPPASLDAATLPAMRTSSNVVVGTPLYLSPEQAMGAAVDARSDLFALGALLYESLTGKPAFSGGSVIEIGAQIIHVTPQPPSGINPRVSSELDRITMKALAKKPEARYQSAGEMLVELRPAREALKSEAGHHTERLNTSQGSHSSALESISETLRRPRLSIGFFTLALIAAAMASWAIFHWISAKPVIPFQNMQVTKLTNTGNSLIAAISPDGRYVAHVVSENGKQSVVVTYMATASDVVVAPPSDARYLGLTFSHDGNYIYYVRQEKNDLGLLYQVPALGGATRRITSNVDSPITVSPDDKQVAFVRYDKGNGEYSLIVSQSDGTNERRITRRKDRDVLSPYGLDWSPDIKTIVCADGSYTGGYHMNLIAVAVVNGAEKKLSSRTWFGILQVRWLKDGTGIILTAQDESASPIQIYYASYPSGEVQRITNDSNRYTSISLTADSSQLVAVQESRQKSIWIAPNGDANRATQIASAVGETFGLAWAPGAKIIYSTMASGKLDLWSMQADGSGRTQLTVNAGSNYHPAVSPNGRYIFFSSNRTGSFNIWRMDADGSNPGQLTAAGSDFYPDPAPDGQWVVYQSGGGGSGKPTLWKVPVNGGQPQQLTEVTSSVPAVSPDGKLIVSRYWDETDNVQKVAIFPYAGGRPIRTFKIPIHDWQRIRWTLDSGTLTYVDLKNGVSNIWKQPLDGGPAVQATDFRAEQIFSYDWSPDGKQLACERGSDTTDVILMSTKR
ncbi:MAG: protein kinase [Acidobacteriota bacterium]